MLGKRYVQSQKILNIMDGSSVYLILRPTVSLKKKVAQSLKVDFRKVMIFRGILPRKNCDFPMNSTHTSTSESRTSACAVNFPLSKKEQNEELSQSGVISHWFFNPYSQYSVQTFSSIESQKQTLN
jgi:hypothetical protein